LGEPDFAFLPAAGGRARDVAVRLAVRPVAAVFTLVCLRLADNVLTPEA
jgi:hypothetical protein